MNKDTIIIIVCVQAHGFEWISLITTIMIEINVFEIVKNEKRVYLF